MAYKCVITLYKSNGDVLATHRSRVLEGPVGLSYARRMDEIYPKAKVSLKYALVAHGDKVAFAA